MTARSAQQKRLGTAGAFLLSPDANHIADSPARGDTYAVADPRCVHELLPNQCGICSPRPGAIDLHPQHASSHESGFAREVVATVYVHGLPYGLVPSGGEAYVFGSGHGLHHRRECSDGADTPPDRILRLSDPSGDLWRSVTDPQSVEMPQRIVNVDGRPVTVCCGVCALRPQSR